MTKLEFRKMIFEDKKATFNSPFELKKISELIEVLSEEECDLIALEIATNFDSKVLSLKHLINFVKTSLITNACFLADKTKLINSNYNSKFEETKALRMFYFKKALKRMPKWAKKAILGSD